MEKTGSRPTNELVKAAVAGDALAFTALWDMYINQLRAYIKGMMKSLDDFFVDDICSRSFEKAFRQIGTFDPERSQFITWLRVIARNTALDLKDREDRLHPRNQIIYIDDDSRLTPVVDTIPDHVDNALDTIIKEESDGQEALYVERLPELYKKIASMRLIEGMQYKEIAAELDMPLNTVRTRIRRANSLILQMRRDNGEDQEL